MQEDGNRVEDADDSMPTPVLPVDSDVEVGPDYRSRERRPFLLDARRVLSSRWDLLLVIAAGGAIGSVARWSLGRAFSTESGAFPTATFLENVSGSFLLGLLMVFVLEVWPPSRYLRPFLGVGVLGGYTTFSTYMLDTRSLIVAGRAPLAGAYVLGSLLVGLVAVWAGIALGRTVAEGRGRQGGKDADPDERSQS